MGARRIRREQRRFDMAKSRRVNGMRKMGERHRRSVRMLEIIQKGKFPYTPPVLSWLSARLDTPGSRIVQTDVDALVKKVQAEIEKYKAAKAAAV